MYLAFDTRIVLLICCLMQGLAGLRLLKVSIPAYKMRGESVFLECQYELSKVHDLAQTRTRNNQQGNGRSGNDMNYVDADSAGDDVPGYRHMHTYPYQRQQHQQHQQHQHQQQHQQQHHQEHHQQQRQQRQPYQQPRSRSGSSYYSQQHHGQQQEQQHQQQYQTLPSPYGHSVYRGRSGSVYGGRAGASTFNGDTYRGSAHMEREDSLGESSEREEEVDEEEEEEEEQKGEALYAIKWYKDNEEFYRYVPKANPPKTSYRVDGVRVVEEHSDSARVLLRGLTINSTGLYRCEISAEAPNFSSVQSEGRMDIVYLPRDGPHIKGQQFQYQIGETLNLNCSSGKSHPASHLQWFINDHPVLEEHYLERYNDTVHKHGLITSTLGLLLVVDARHFHDGAMRVKCLASISPVLWKGDKESVLQRRSGIIDNREAMLLVRSSATNLREHSLRSTTALLLLLEIWAQIFFII